MRIGKGKIDHTTGANKPTFPEGTSSVNQTLLWRCPFLSDEDCALFPESNWCQCLHGRSRQRTRRRSKALLKGLYAVLVVVTRVVHVPHALWSKVGLVVGVQKQSWHLSSTSVQAGCKDWSRGILARLVRLVITCASHLQQASRPCFKQATRHLALT